jgi:hypothetical protein
MDKFEEGSKGTANPLRAYAMASSGDNFSSFKEICETPLLVFEPSQSNVLE